MNLVEILPHFNVSMNATSAVLLIAALLAIRRGNRVLHRRLMIITLCVSVAFLSGYVLEVALAGHTRFPGDDWVRTFFLVMLTSHTILAVSIVPLVLRTVYLALNERFAQHRRIARVTYPIWIYVLVTGMLVYWMNNHLRPPL